MPADTQASDWKVRWKHNVEVLGVVHQVFRFGSKVANEERDLAFFGYGQRVGASAGSDAAWLWTSLRCETSFSINDLHGRKGELMGMTLGGIVFQAGVLLISAENLFKRTQLRHFGLGVGGAAFHAYGRWIK
ncbi:MAG: hypothetical protein KF889_07220 [Alphaproteobacteria bacterium]|nr:hypothetical protein [Alphaproteobacteria bacterium]MCW5740611.1 hypothetical protein [Alphaproteobacteria bacterium]